MVIAPANIPVLIKNGQTMVTLILLLSIIFNSQRRASAKPKAANLVEEYSETK